MKATEQYFAAVLSLYTQLFLILDLEDIIWCVIQLKPPNDYFDLVHSGIERSTMCLGWISIMYLSNIRKARMRSET